MAHIDGERSIAHWLASLLSDEGRDRELDALIQLEALGMAIKVGWIDLFSMQMELLGARADSQALLARAETLFWTHGHLDPLEVAEAEILKWSTRDE